MPVVNPNPSYEGEMDHVDPELIPKIIIEPDFLFDCKDNSKKKVSFMLEPFVEDKIKYIATFHDNEHRERKITTQQFEETMSSLIHGDKSKRIEQTELFMTMTKEMISEYIANQKQVENLFIRLGSSNLLRNGLGVIYDTKAEQDVGTFEDFGFFINKNLNDQIYNIHDIFFAGRTDKEVSGEIDRFTYSYYNLDEMLVYSIKPNVKAQISEAEIGNCTFEFNKVNISVSRISEQDPKLELIRAAQEVKSLMKGADHNDPLYQEDFEKFKEARMAIIRSIQEKAKKQKMVSMFADIDL